MTPELKTLFNKLTRLQKGVCLGLLGGLNYADAYFGSGGLAKNTENANSIVSRMLSTDVNVIAFMDAAEGEVIDDAIMTKQEALQGLTNIANGNIADLVDFSTVTLQDAEGNDYKQTVWSLKDDVELNRDQMALISELAATKDGFKFKTHSQLQAKKQLADMLGWNAPTKVAETNTDGEDVEPVGRELARRIAFILAKATQEVSDNDTKDE